MCDYDDDNCTVFGFDPDDGYGRWGNAGKRVQLKEMTLDEQKAFIKKLWEEDPIKYSEFKAQCIRIDYFPDLFGTHDNPKPIDESKL